MNAKKAKIINLRLDFKKTNLELAGGKYLFDTIATLDHLKSLVINLYTEQYSWEINKSVAKSIAKYLECFKTISRLDLNLTNHMI